jgi:uncharacterized protein YaaR (DUF327 family)
VLSDLEWYQVFQCIFQSIFVDFFTVELALPFVGINVLGRNLELSEMEETIKKYKQQISHKVDEILSLKYHIGSISDTRIAVLK